MNIQTEKCVYEVIARLEQHVTARTPVACAVLVDRDNRSVFISDLSYWETEGGQEAFERRAAELAKENNSVRGALGTPMVVHETEDDFYFSRPVNMALPEGVREQIWVFSFDLDEGYDLTRVLFTRRPDGSPVFDEPETYRGSTTVNDATPGFVLLRTLLED